MSEEDVIVYCFECIHYDMDNQWCKLYDQPRNDFDFCSLAELAEFEDQVIAEQEALDMEFAKFVSS